MFLYFKLNMVIQKKCFEFYYLEKEKLKTKVFFFFFFFFFLSKDKRCIMSHIERIQE
jgi:hypothetical protein